MHIANLENGKENGNGKVPTGKEVPEILREC